MTPLQQIEIAESYLKLVRKATEEFQHEIDDMKMEYNRLDQELSMPDIGRIIGRSSSTVNRMLNDGRLANKKMSTVLSYTKKPH
jgi:transposase-like protein